MNCVELLCLYHIFSLLIVAVLIIFLRLHKQLCIREEQVLTFVPVQS